MGSRYPQPDNEDAFEEMCLRFYRKLWKNEGLVLYAKRGEQQDGVDIHDPLCLKPTRAVQCKHHEPTKTLPPAEIKKEVQKAENSKLPIDHYVIATTARKTRTAQNTVSELNRRERIDRKFSVEIHFWEEICQFLGNFSRFQAESIVFGRAAAVEILASILQDPEVRSIAARALAVPDEAVQSEKFSEIEQLLLDRNFEAARHELDKLPANLASLPNDDQYRILRLRAKLSLETGDFERASALFLEAFERHPELDQAKHNRVLGYALVLNPARAFELAVEYVTGGLATPAMLARLIENAPDHTRLLEHMALIEPHLATSEEINLALCHKLLRFGDGAGATEAARRALAIAPGSPHALFATALSAHSMALTADWQTQRQWVADALLHYDAAADAARRGKYATLLPEILINRATCSALGGDKERASANYLEAIAAASSPAPYAALAVTYFLHEGENERAWPLLDRLDATTTDGRFLVALTEFYNTDDVAERYRYLSQLRRLCNVRWSRAVECRFHCVSLALLLDDPVLARKCIPKSFVRKFPFQAYTALAWVDLESGDSNAALENADRALGQSPRGAHPQEVRLLADVFNRCNQPAKALELLEEIARPGALDENTRRLIVVAQRLERHDLLLRVCRELRKSGAQDDQLRRLEIQLLSRYAPAEGLKVVDEFIDVSVSPAYFVAFKNNLALRFNQRELLLLDPSRLPTANDLSPSNSWLVVRPYIAVGKYDEALQFLYEQRRLNFEDAVGHTNYVSFFLMQGEKTSLHHSPERVLPNTAALLSDGEGIERWVIVENDNPVPSRGEFAETSDLALRVLGRSVGDVVELPGLARVDRATIRAIQTKYVRAFQDSLGSFRQRFPETPFLQPIDVGTGDQFDPTPILVTLKQRREFVTKCFETYDTQPCPLYLLASSLGVSELDAIGGLIYRSKPMVKCCRTTPVEFAQAVQLGLGRDIVVLDLSAIITLNLVDGWHFLDPQIKYVVSQSTSELVDQWLIDAESAAAREGGHLSATEEGDLRFQEPTVSQQEARQAELEKMRKGIAEHCDRKSSEAVAALSPEKRQSYEKVAGFHNVESMSLARDLNGLLWSDDLVLGIIASADFGVKTVWTQLVLRCFVASKRLATADFELVSAKLASWGYALTIWNAQTIIAAGERANWSPHDWPFEPCINLISTVGLPIPAKARIVLDCLMLLRQSGCSELRQSAVIQSLLSAIGSREAVIWIARRLSVDFSTDVTSEKFLQLELRYWLESAVL
jgi:tetratricopeptide (TPR) repeat protein